MPLCFISLGSNIQPEYNLCSATHALRKEFGILIESSFYQSKAEGFVGDDFWNSVAGFHSDSEPMAIYQRLRKIEEQHGRVRGGPKFSARTLDLDLILYGEHIIHLPELKLPHPQIEQYIFVLEPLAEIYPEGIYPLNATTYQDMLQAMGRKKQAIHRLTSPLVSSD